jgi:UDP-N-acetylglucosamine--N-acetylmuramyl-(pentapeptide) pyrophosphoryl-undecaprenol N-acetylglucosamine transferase
MSRTILVMAGGTGGHIFPALAVAEQLRGLGWRVVWLGSRRGMEGRLVAPLGYEMAWIRFSGVRGRGPLRLAWLPLELLVAFWQSARAIFAHRPDVALGMGGYVSFPGAMMASFLNRPLAIHEQNAVAGLANRVLARVADRVLAGFPGAFGKGVAAIVTGNPVRAEIAAIAPPRERFAGREGPLRLLVVGGSQGARVLNEVVPRALAALEPGARPRVTHQAGAAHEQAVRLAYEQAGVAAEVLGFMDDMAARYAEADLVVCRAGASTVAELAAAGVASILVPYPHAVDDHQSANARYLAERGAALVVPEREFTASRLRETLAALDRERLRAMAEAARAAGRPEAARAVAQVCVELAGA